MDRVDVWDDRPVTDTHTSLQWHTSPWDHRSHAFRALGEMVSTAICEHSARTEKLTPPTEDTIRCLACMLMHGDELADQHGDRVVWT